MAQPRIPISRTVAVVFEMKTSPFLTQAQWRDEIGPKLVENGPLANIIQTAGGREPNLVLSLHKVNRGTNAGRYCLVVVDFATISIGAINTELGIRAGTPGNHDPFASKFGGILTAEIKQAATAAGFSASDFSVEATFSDTDKATVLAEARDYLTTNNAIWYEA